MRKIINISKEPYEFTFDGGNYGPYAPGEIIELPDHIADHAVKRSVIHDQDPEGTAEVVGFKAAYLSNVRSQGTLDGIATFKCPWIERDECQALPFRNSDDLRKHIDTHLPKGRASGPINAAAAARP